ncbi:MAG: hypothetical protein ACETWC_00030 [Acidobacteriota bacterium]
MTMCGVKILSSIFDPGQQEWDIKMLNVEEGVLTQVRFTVSLFVADFMP